MIHPLGRIFWALRKLSLPIKLNDIVLDVGSGGNPYSRSDILLDRFTGKEHRGGTPMLIDRLAIIGDATKLPFKDKSIDFIIASHVLEHMDRPELFLKELQRVGKAGYIETPNFICERLIPCDAHSLEIANIDNRLVIHKKSKKVEDSYMAHLNFTQKSEDWKKLYFYRPELFHMRYLWKDEIQYTVVNPEVPSDWMSSEITTEDSDVIHTHNPSQKISWRTLPTQFIYWVHKLQRKFRLKNFNLLSIMACPECHGNLVNDTTKQRLICEHCGLYFESKNSVVDFDNKKNLQSRG